MRRLALAVLLAGVTAATIGGCGAGSGSRPTAGSPVAPTRQVLVALPLAVRAAGLEEFAHSLSGPGASASFLSVGSIAARYGAPAAAIATDLRRLRAMGLNFRVDPSHGALWGAVTAAQAGRFFDAPLHKVGGVIGPAVAPQIPAGLTGVTGVIGLTVGTPKRADARGSTPSPSCPARLMSARSLAPLFGFTRLLREGQDGAGASVDILAVHDWQPAVLANYERCTGGEAANLRMSQDYVPLTPRLEGGTEIALDALVLGTLVPRAHLGVTTYDGDTSLAFPLMELLAHSGRGPDVLNITVDYCEDELSGAERGLTEWLLAVLAADGTTTMAAAGDFGSSGCHPQTDEPSPTYPAASAFVTAVGGVEFAGRAEAPAMLRPWNEPGHAGGGGGTSAAVAAPPWQSGAGRRVPDTSAFAAPTGAGAIPVCVDAERCVWREQGGTSLAATALSAVAAMVAGSDGSHAVRFGNLAPRLWRSAPGASTLRDVTQGSNATFSKRCCEARPGYDTASGWGLFIPDRLAGSLIGRRR